MRSIGIFARHPVPGCVKTRLASVLSAPLACQLYRGMLGDAVAAAQAARADRRIIFWAEVEEGAERFEVPKDFETRLQEGPDLGVRLEKAFAQLITVKGDRALMIGADCPMFGAGEIRSAFAALDGCDLVLGPTGDGGYYLVGLRRSVPELFRGISWSTELVRQQTRERAAEAGLKVTELDRLDDIDTAEDLIQLISSAIGGPDRCGIHAREALTDMGLFPSLGS